MQGCDNRFLIGRFTNFLPWEESVLMLKRLTYIGAIVGFYQVLLSIYSIQKVYYQMYLDAFGAIPLHFLALASLEMTAF